MCRVRSRCGGTRTGAPRTSETPRSLTTPSTRSDLINTTTAATNSRRWTAKVNAAWTRVGHPPHAGVRVQQARHRRTFMAVSATHQIRLEAHPRGQSTRSGGHHRNSDRTEKSSVGSRGSRSSRPLQITNSKRRPRTHLETAAEYLSPVLDHRTAHPRFCMKFDCNSRI